MNTNELEQKIFEQFKKMMKDEIEGLDLFPAIEEDSWEDGENCCLVMESQDNGKVWECYCTKSGKIKDIIEVG